MRNYPLIKFVLIFIIGILIQKIAELTFHQWFYTTIFLLLLFILASLILRKRNFQTLSLLLYFLVMSFGAMFFALDQSNKTIFPFEKYKYRNTYVYGEITDLELYQTDRIEFTAEVDSVEHEDKTVQANLKLLCRIYPKKEENAGRIFKNISIGNEFIAKGTLTKAPNKRNPGEFNYEAYLSDKGIHGLFSCYNEKLFGITDDSENFFFNKVFEIRKSIDESIRTLHNEQSAGLLRGLLLADRGEIDYDTRKLFVNAGIIHILAVSGLHVGFVILIFFFLFNRLNVYLRYILTILGLLFFLMLTAGQPSVFRATTMAVIMLISLLTGRSYHSLNALAFAAFLLLLFNPSDIFNPGFQLSFSAVLAILLLFPVFREKIYKLNIPSILQKIILFAAVSVSAQIGTLPFTVIYFNKISLIGIIANIFAIPLVGVVVALGILTIVLSFLWSGIALIYASANELFAWLLFSTAEVLGNLEFSHLYVRQFSVIDTILFYLFAALLFYQVKITNNIKVIGITTVLVLINLYLFLSLDNYKLLPEGKLSILNIDVGQGDAALVKFPNNETALIDAGNATRYFDNGERIIKPLMNHLGIDKIDHGFISHVDGDHYRGFLSLIEAGKIRRIYKPPVDTSVEKDVNLEKFLEKNQVPVTYYSKTLMEFGNAKVYFLTDTKDYYYKHFDSNNKSGVMKIVHGSNGVIFVGDIEKKAELILVEKYGDFLNADLLKAGHHGSKTSSALPFIKTVEPKTTVISAEIQNRFNHPSPVVLRRFNKLNVNIHRIDKNGAILYQSNGKNINFVHWKKLESLNLFD